MADKAELRNMVLSFRVSELQLLLGLTSQSRCGRKTELMQRALALVERGVSMPVQLKIRELYQRFTPRTSGYSPPPQSLQTLGHHLTSSVMLGKSSSMAAHSANMPSNTMNRGNGIQRNINEMMIQQQRSQMPTHPDVKFKHLPFYDLLSEIMRPTSLVVRSSAKQQEARFNFCLSEQQVREISSARDVQAAPDRGDFVVQVQLRFCLLDTTCRQPDTFPSNIIVKVNGMIAPLPNLIPTNKPGVEPKRPSRPVDITRICRLSSSVSNNMIISWNADPVKNHCVGVYLVKKLDSNILLQRLKRAGTLKVEQTKQIVRDKLSLDTDADLATTSLRVSLLCPLGKMRMTLPCRASTCNHLQCFDGPTFLQMNEKKPTWMCPVCDRPADFNRLVIDGLFTDIIRDSADSTEVELTKDGRWHVTKTDDSDDDSQCNSPKPAATLKSSSHAATKVVSAAPACDKPDGGAGGGGDCIDLTETDDEGIEQSLSNSRCASTTTTSYTPGGTISSPPRSNSPTVAVYDLSPDNIPTHSPPPPSLPPISPHVSQTRELITTPPLPPMAHQTYTSFTLSKRHNMPSHASSFPATPPPAHGGSRSRTPYLPTADPHAAYGGLGYDALLQPDMMDFLAIMSGISDYAVNPQFSLPSNAFDYLYTQQRLDSDRERKGRGSPTSSA